jgi:hypothetical protein
MRFGMTDIMMSHFTGTQNIRYAFEIECHEDPLSV